MVGNAAEEGLMQQIGNPSHLDWGRIVVPAAFLSGYGAGYLTWRVLPFATIWLALLVGAIVCILVGWRLAAWFERRAWAKWCAEQEAQRSAHAAETERAIAALKAERGT